MIDDFYTTAGIGVLSFTTTNMDDFILLVIFFSSRKPNLKQILISQFIGIFIIISLSLIGAYTSTLLIPSKDLRWLGIIPIILGLIKIIGRKKTRDSTKKENRIHRNEIDLSFQVPGDYKKIDCKLPKQIQPLTLAFMIVASGGDNIAVYAPLFASSSSSNQVELVVIYFLMAALWCTLAYAFTSRIKIKTCIQPTADKWLPFILISIGIYILLT